MSNDLETSDVLARHLGNEERILWHGRPKQGLIFGTYDWFTLVFGLFWTVFSIVWVVAATSDSAMFAIFGVPFVAIGVYTLTGRFLLDARARKHTYYAVTNQRVVIVSGSNGSKVSSVLLRTMTDLTSKENNNGGGTITFGRDDAMAKMYGSMASTFGMSVAPSFILASDVRRVLEIVREAQVEELRTHLRA